MPTDCSVTSARELAEQLDAIGNGDETRQRRIARLVSWRAYRLPDAAAILRKDADAADIAFIRDIARHVIKQKKERES